MSIKLREVAAVRVARGPIVLDGPVLTRTSIFTGEASEFIVRLDKGSLKEVWRKRRMAWVRGAYDAGVLVYAGNTQETQLWNENGKILWKRRGNDVATNGRLHFNEGGRLQVVDVMSGRTIDEFDCPPGTPDLVHDGVLLLRHPEGTDPVQAVDLATRGVVWKKSLIPAIRDACRDPCPYGLSFASSCPGQVVAKSGQHLVAVSLADGRLLWVLALPVPYRAPMARDGRMYVWSTASAPAATRVTFDLDSGEVTRQRAEQPASENRFVIVDEATGNIVVDRQLGAHGAAFRRVQEAYGGVICHNHVVFTSASGLMALFRLSDGELVWHHEYGDQLFSPSVEDNRLYVACADGHIVVFEAEGGEL